LRGLNLCFTVMATLDVLRIIMLGNILIVSFLNLSDLKPQKTLFLKW